MNTDLDAKKAAILKMLRRFGSQAARLTEDQINDYFDAAEEMSLEAIQQACYELREGLVARNNEFLPSPIELTINARRYDRTVADHDARRGLEKIVSYKIGELPPPSYEPLGPTKIEIGGRMVDVSHLTFEQKNEALRTGRLPDEETPATPKLRGF